MATNSSIEERAAVVAEEISSAIHAARPSVEDIHVRGVEACIAQMRRHAENHARALFVVYSASGAILDAARLSSGLPGNATLVITGGPPIAASRQAT